MNNRVCSKCACTKTLGEFYSGYAHCIICVKVSQKLYRQTRATYWKTRNREYYAQNRDTALSRAKVYYQENKAKIRLAERRRRANNPQVRAAFLLRNRLCKALKNKTHAMSSVRDIGLPMDALLVYLNLDALDKYGVPYTGNTSLFHIDHIRPLASFNLTQPKDYQAAVHWSNLQVLTVRENLAKGARHTTHLAQSQ